MHGSLVTSSLVSKTTENESANFGSKFGQEETENIVAADNYFGRLIFQYASFNNSRVLARRTPLGPLPFFRIAGSAKNRVLDGARYLERNGIEVIQFIARCSGLNFVFRSCGPLGYQAYYDPIEAMLEYGQEACYQVEYQVVNGHVPKASKC